MSTFWILLEQMELFVIYILKTNFDIGCKVSLLNNLLFTSITPAKCSAEFRFCSDVSISVLCCHVFYQYGDRTDISRKRKNGADLSDHEHVWKYRIYGDPHYHQYLSGKRHFVRVGIFHC